MINTSIKRIFLFWVIVAALAGTVSGQTSIDRRALSTKIADVLAKFPAENNKQLQLNMQAIVDLGEAGFEEMTNMLVAPGKGDNTSLEYALSAFSAFASKSEEHRKMAVRVFGKALDETSMAFSREFLIHQLQLIGEENAIATLAKHLKDQELGEPSARALAQIGSGKAGEALLVGLTGATDQQRVYLVQALGDMAYKPAASSIQQLVGGQDNRLQKVVFEALAHIASPASAATLEKAALAVKYNYDITNAAGAYLQYLKNLNQSGDRKKALDLSRRLMKTSAATPVHVRIAALDLYAHAAGAKGVDGLRNALKDKDPEYTAAALQLLKKSSSTDISSQLLKMMKSLTPQTRVQVIRYLAATGDKNLLPDLYSLMKDKDSSARLAAIKAIGVMGDHSSATPLLQVLEQGTASEVAAAKQSLLMLKGPEITEELKNALKQVPAPAQAEIVNILGLQASGGAVNEIFGLLNSNDAAVKKAAFTALPSVVAANDGERLFPLLNSCSENELPYVQQSVIAALGGINDTARVLQSLTTSMAQADAGKRYRYLKILGASGGVHSIQHILRALQTGDDRSKKEAISALSQIHHPHSAALLLAFVRENRKSALAKDAVDGYINITSAFAFPPEQKLLMLQEAMSNSTDVQQKKRILNIAANLPLFQSLMFASKYLDDTELRQNASQAVLRVLSSRSDLKGGLVKDIINKTLAVIGGTDSEYHKQSLRKTLAEMPSGEGFAPLFNGKDLTGWKGLVANPIERKKMNPATLKKEQEKANALVPKGWQVQDGFLVFTGHGENLVTEKKYGDFEMLVDWKITKDGDAGIYLRGTPQVQIWDTARRDVGAEVGSGGLYNNEKHPSKPLQVADNAVGEWNNFRIIMKGDRVTVYLNGVLVTDSTVLENYWDRTLSIFPEEQIELQAHGTYVAYRNIYIKELDRSTPYVLSEEEKKEGFKILFDGTSLDQWQGDKSSYVIENGNIVVKPGDGHGGNLFTKDEYADFVFRFEFQLTPGANNGLGVRAPLQGDAAYAGMEIQILDDDADIYKNLERYQYHGSVYGIMPAKRGHLKKTGEWNTEEVTLKGSKIKVVLNNEVIVDGDLAEATKNGTLDKLEHPGLKRKSGHIGFLGHGSEVRFRNVRVKKLDK